MQRLVEVFCFNDCQYGSKDFFLGNARMWVYIGEYSWLDKVARPVMTSTSRETAFVLAYLDIVGDLLQGVLINDWTHVSFRFGEGHHGPGYFIEPTVFADVDPHARIAQEEIFGPGLAGSKARGFQDALRSADHTGCGRTGEL